MSIRLCYFSYMVMRQCLFIVILAIGILPSFCFSMQSDKSNLALLPFAGDNTLTSDQLNYITSVFSGELIELNKYNVIDRSKMEFILQEQGFQQSGVCNSSECRVQIGQLLGVDKLISGNLIHLDNSYALHVELLNISTGVIEKSVTTEQQGLFSDIYKQLCHNASRMLIDSTDMHLFETPSSIPISTTLSTQPQAFSLKKQVALAVVGLSLIGTGCGIYFNSQGESHANEYDEAIRSNDFATASIAYNQTTASEHNRNQAYTVSIASLGLAAILWFWPE